MVDKDSRQFPIMLYQWQAVLNQHKKATEHIAREDVRVWNSLFSKMCEKQESLMASGGWLHGPSDILSIIGRSRRELYHSDILAWLMDPNARHGLGAAFLMRVLNRVLPDQPFSVKDLQHTVVGREIARARCRADLVVWCKAVTLVFEVKVDAVERENQCGDLYSDFCGEVGAQFIFLTPNGYPPRTTSAESEKSFIRMSFKHILTDLQSAISSRPNEFEHHEGYHTICTYFQTLQKEFS
jgi:hypothetical protein